MLRSLFDKLARHGRILVLVDQPASIGALPVAVARACGHQVAYLPGLAMRRVDVLHTMLRTKPPTSPNRWTNPASRLDQTHRDTPRGLLVGC